MLSNTTVHPFLDEFVEFGKATVYFVICVCQSTWNNWAYYERIFMKFGI
jgi:hypothetical protein